MKKLSGYTLIEILIVFALIGILSGIIFSTYRVFLSTHKEKSISAMKEMDLLELQIFLKKLIGSIGFGVDLPKLKISNVFCDDTNLSNFKNTNSTIGLISNCTISNGPNHDRLYFRSLYANDDDDAGCWWYVDVAGKKHTMGVDKYGAPCDPQGKVCIFLNLSRLILNNNIPCTVFPGQQGFLFFYKEAYSSNPPEVFRLHLSSFEEDDTAQKQKCAPKSGKLMFQKEAISQPLFDCIGGMKFQLVYYNPSDSLPSALRMCLLVQVSGRTSTKSPVPLTSHCGEFQQGDSDWEYYRWRVIEEIIPLENLRGI